ncbi:MAG: hypothetical protein KBB86_02035 [Candidatus Pacebacteria bacterium]|nr:hypothetical protein [Candidatus Paceibacterota bacterium]
MEKGLENSVSLDTGKLCTSCKQHNIFEKIERKIIRWVSNGRIGGSGPGGYAETEIVIVYFCGGCGQTFLPTKINKIDQNLESHKKAMLPLLEENTPLVLNRSLGCGEVFEEVAADKNKSEYVRLKKNDQYFFGQGSLVRIASEKRGFQESFEYHNSWERDFDSNPYLVPTNVDNVFSITWWAKKVHQNAPLLKGEAREKLGLLKHELAGIKLKIKPKKGSSIKTFSHGHEWEIKSIEQQIDKIKAGTQTKEVRIDTKPLPKGSVMAKLVKVVDPKTASIRRFYIPQDSLK